MRRILPLTLACFVGAGVGACTPAEVITTENIPTAGVRFVNAVPDTAGAFGMDFRFVDILESNAQYRITFRNGPSTTVPFVSTTIQFKGAREGSRRFRVFFDDTLQAIAQIALVDTTVSLTANHNYSAFLWGRARSSAADKMHLTFQDESSFLTNSDTTLVALRVVNATSNAIDVRAYVQGGALPAAPTWAAVPAYSTSAYIFVAPAIMMYNVQPAGGGANLFADAQAMPGAPANCDLHFPCLTGEQPDIEAQPGTNVAGSGVSAIVFPPSTAQEPAPAAATVALAAGAGSVDNGAHQYKVTFVTGTGNETSAGAASAAVTVVDKTVNGKVTVSGIPTGSALVKSRNIYRTTANGTGYFLLTTLNDNTTTTYTDNTADAALGTIGAPATNTTIRTPQGAAFQVPAITFMWDRRPPRGCKPTLCG